MWEVAIYAVASAAASMHAGRQLGEAVKDIEEPVVIEYPLMDLVGRLIGTAIIVLPIGLILWPIWPWK